MSKALEHVVAKATSTTSVERDEVIQTLWSGYGEIVRYKLYGAAISSVVVKHVRFPTKRHHPRGWNNDRGHQRKVHSYEVEMAWYASWAKFCDDDCRVPQCFSSQVLGDEHVMVLEDLDAEGFYMRKTMLDFSEVKGCLSWLAHFHARFMGEAPEGLWPIGTYWHLATRPDELAKIADHKLRKAAPKIDRKLNQTRYKTLVHGDAKVANFCFSDDGQVAAVDFQYVGGGCGMKDVAYLLGSCLNDEEQSAWESELLDYYFHVLGEALSTLQSKMDIADLEQEWRSLFAVAQADFYRFLVGWMPTHWKINDYSKAVALAVVKKL